MPRVVPCRVEWQWELDTGDQTQCHDAMRCDMIRPDAVHTSRDLFAARAPNEQADEDNGRRHAKAVDQEEGDGRALLHGVLVAVAVHGVVRRQARDRAALAGLFVHEVVAIIQVDNLCGAKQAGGHGRQRMQRLREAGKHAEAIRRGRRGRGWSTQGGAPHTLLPTVL